MDNTPRRRILYTQRPRGGGSTVSLYELIKGLDTTRYEPIVLFFNKNAYIENFKKLGIKTLTLNPSQSKKNRYGKHSFIGKIYQLLLVDIPLAWHIACLIKKEKIDLVHQNLGFDRAVMMAAGATGTPQVCHFRHFIGKIPYIVKRLSSSVDAVLYTTQAIADDYINLGVTVARKAVVYEPIDIQRFSKPQDTRLIRQQFSIADNEYVVSNIGRITPWKGHDYFLHAMEDVIAHYPNTKILIVGEPGENSRDKKYFDALQTMAQKASLKARVIFTGNRNDIPEIMAASDIVVHSASEPEPFGLVIAEAMATGIPIIATQGGGTAEIIKNGVTGLLVPMKSAEGIKEAIQKLLGSKTLRESIGRKARQDVTQRFLIERHVTQIQNIYEDIFDKTLKTGRK